MEIIYVLLLLLIIYFQINNKNNLATHIETLERDIADLKYLIMQTMASSSRKESKPDVQQAPDNKPVVPVATVEDVLPSPPPVYASPVKHVEKQPGVITDPYATIRRQVKTSDYTPPVPPEPEEPELSFFERYPDLEKFIGENLINKIGIAILVLAIGFFVKYAIDNNWIGPVGRVGIGVLCGGILIGIAHRMRNTYTAFSSVLVGGGLAILYFTITLAYHQFHLFGQTTSFIILVIITGFAVALSLLYNKQELAIIALVGGLSSPLMVSGDKTNYHALFIYLIILNAGLLIIAYRKSWRVLNISAFASTVLIVGGIVFSLTAQTYIMGLIYGAILYLLFFAINVANNVKENKKFIASDFSILLINTALYFALGLYLLTAMHQDNFRGLFSAALAVINLILSYLLFKNKKVDANILYLLIGITLTFISLTAPIQLHGHNITLFWAAEAVLLYWLYQKSDILLMKLTSIIVWAAMLLSLYIVWLQVYGYNSVSIAIMANKGFVTTIVAAISSFMLFKLTAREEPAKLYGITIESGIYKYVAFLLLLISGLLEINYQFSTRYPGTQLPGIYLMLYVPVFICTFYGLAKKVQAMQLNWVVGAVMLSSCILVYLLFYPQFFEAQYSILITHKLAQTHFIAHWLGAIFIGIIFYQLVSIAKNHLSQELQKIATWVICGSAILFLSFEVCLLSNQIFYSNASTLNNLQTVYIKVGLPILWGLLSFVLMWLGMRNKASTLRIISLTLFSITLVKLFVFDIQNIPPAGKIAAFFCLGVLLLIVSFMYQKVKNIIAEDSES
jgi:uncharacterized membrane protein